MTNPDGWPSRTRHGPLGRRGAHRGPGRPIGGRGWAALLLLLLAGCATAPPAPPLDLSRPETVIPDAAHEWQTLRGLARVEYAGPAGQGGLTQVVVAALPDRCRLESLTPLGTVGGLLVVRGPEIRLHAVLSREYASGRATRESLERLTGLRVPPEPLLRLLAGLPPLPVRWDDPRSRLAEEGTARRLETVAGPFWQRIWLPTGSGPIRGELGEAGGLLARFGWEEQRPVNGWLFPHRIQVETAGGEARLSLAYETVRLGEAIDPALFELPRPTDPGLTILDLDQRPALPFPR